MECFIYFLPTVLTGRTGFFAFFPPKFVGSSKRFPSLPGLTHNSCLALAISLLVSEKKMLFEIFDLFSEVSKEKEESLLILLLVNLHLLLVANVVQRSHVGQ